MTHHIASVFNLALDGVQKLIPYTPGKPIDELERELGLSHIVKLASNESPLGLNPNITKAITKALPELNRYPDGGGFNLKTALSKKLGVNVDQITLGNGSNDLLEIITRSFVNTELEIIYSQHAFAVYPIVTQAVGATARVIPAKNYGHDLDAMLEAVNEKTRLVFIANPNNPTGTLLKPEAIKNFIAALPKTVLCVLDEAYFEFIEADKRADSISWLTEFPHLIITRTFSKAYGLAGLRIGYSLSSPEIADLLNRVRQPFNNNALALVAAETALADKDYLALAVKTNNEGMAQLTTVFKFFDLEWIPSAGNFVSVDFKQNAMPIYQTLLQKGVIVRPVGGIYEMPNYLRISISTKKENLFFIEALKAVLEDI
jgi:histidinol-phosphate aminotransferase